MAPGAGTDGDSKPANPGRRALLLAATAASSALLMPARATPRKPAPKLKRGGSIHTMMNWADLAPGSKDTFAWPPFSAPRFQTPPDFLRTLGRTGIDFIRITIDQGPFLQAQGARLAELDAILLRKCREILKAGRDVVVDFHPVNQVEAYTPVRIVQDIGGPLFNRYTAMIGRAARTLRALDPARVALEPFNEPPFGYNFFTAARWQKNDGNHACGHSRQQS